MLTLRSVLTTTTTFSTPSASTTLGLVFRVWRLVFCVCFNDSRSLHDWSGTLMKLTLRPEWRLRPLSSFLGFLDIKTGVLIAILFAVRVQCLCAVSMSLICMS